MTVVLDASALLAWLHGEPGGESISAVLNGASISAVNWSEVVQKSLQVGVDVNGMQGDVTEMGLTIAPFTAVQAEHAARLWTLTRRYGLSLGDRACLALALEHSASVMTADRTWSELDVELDILTIR